MMEDQLAKTAVSRRRQLLLWRHPGRHHGVPLLQLIPDRPAMPNLDRWYAAISSRPAFQEQIATVPLT